MLYHLLLSLHDTTPWLGALNVTRYITFRTAAASITAMLISLVVGPMLIRRLQELPVRPGDPSRRPGQPSAQGRHADDGRPADPDGGDRADAALGRPDEPLRLDRGASRRSLFGVVGFLDDYLKISRRSHHGLWPRYKMGGQIVVGARRRR